MKSGGHLKNPAEGEIGAVRKNWTGRISVALVFPNTYPVGMANLGFQTVYRLLNQMDHVVCERVFVPESRYDKKAGPVSMESGSPLSRFHVIAASISFESDYPNLIHLMDQGGVPVYAQERNQNHPLVMAGGVACFINPEPLAPFLDLVVVGEAEPILESIFQDLDPLADRERTLEDLLKIPGVYIPRFYRPSYRGDFGPLISFESRGKAPKKVQRVFEPSVDRASTSSSLIGPGASFKNTFLVEVSRGCAHGCRFCAAGFIYRPPRFASADKIIGLMKKGAEMSGHIGLVGAAVSDHPDLEDLCAWAMNRNSADSLRLSFSSFRADAISPNLVSSLLKSGLKTATVAPDAGSERMRRIINKKLTREDILSTVRILSEQGILNLKLYFMVGLPFEMDSDIQAIVELVRSVREEFAAAGRKLGRMGTVSISLNPFVPKPFTPFQWTGMNPVKTLRSKLKYIGNKIRPVGNVKVKWESPKKAYIQALLSRGDRRLAPLIVQAARNKGNWAEALKDWPLKPDEYVLRHRPPDELFPWDFIDHGVSKSYLAAEYERAANERITGDCPIADCDKCGICTRERALSTSWSFER